MTTRTSIRNPSLAAQQTPEGQKYLQRIREMTPYQRLLYWITERHKIHCRRFPEGYHQRDGFLEARLRGRKVATVLPKETPPPWTDDPILQTVFFCNPYRENDKVTAYLRDNFREEYKDDPCVFLGSILLRWFNYIPTMQKLINANVPQRLSPDSGGMKGSLKALVDGFKILSEHRKNGGQLFSGAYIIKLWNGIGKLEAIMKVMESLVRKCPWLYEDCCRFSLRYANNQMTSIDGMGNFYCYQFIGDLAYTHIFPEPGYGGKRLYSPTDWMTWSFSGPGTSRSIHRLQGRDRRPEGGVWERRVAIPHGATAYLLDLQEKVNKDLVGINKHLPKAQRLEPLHMRNITGCLCEYDKYCRALGNERDLKRGYPGQSPSFSQQLGF